MVNFFAVFIGSLAFFHTSEFLFAASYNREQLGWHSWLFSKPYCAAMFCACLEYAVEVQWVPWLKVPALSWLGLAAVCLGELLRKTAMVTAGSNFTHVIQAQRRQHHRLVTHGIYGAMRHPSYAGWMMWAVGTQLLLCNPICLLGFATAAWRFFQRRIAYEDQLLASFFGPAFEQYRANVPSGVPFVS